MALLHKVVLLLRERNDAFVHVVRGGVAVLLNVAVRGNILRRVDGDLLSGLLKRHDVEQVTEPTLAGTVTRTHISLGRDVQPSLLVINLGLLRALVENVQGHRDTLGDIRIDGEHRGTREDTSAGIGVDRGENLLRC